MDIGHAHGIIHTHRFLGSIDTAQHALHPTGDVSSAPLVNAGRWADDTNGEIQSAR